MSEKAARRAVSKHDARILLSRELVPMKLREGFVMQPKARVDQAVIPVPERPLLNLRFHGLQSELIFRLSKIPKAVNELSQ